MARGSKKRSAEEVVSKELISPKRSPPNERTDKDAGDDAVEDEEYMGLKMEDKFDDDSGHQELAVEEDDAVEDGKEKYYQGTTKEEDVREQNIEEDDDGDEEYACPDGKDEEDEEGDEEPRSIKRQINVAGKPAEAGIIKSIYLENFMCHPKLSLDLCRNVNFINGQNGSGKSAILAGIQICLGASSKRTNRARNLKGLVRKEAAGKNPNTSAKCRVTLLNGGGDAYKPDLYGDKITIERHISLKGGYNGYKLLDANNKEVSRSKKDLDEMLDYLNIQVDNPVAILSQEDAKKFLQGKAEDKYRFFMQATELERIDRTFAAALDQKDELETKKSVLEDTLTAKMELVKTLKQKVDEFQAVENLLKKRLDTEVDYAWAFFAERNADYEEAAASMSIFQKKVEARELELSQAEEEASGANDQTEENRIRSQMDDLKNEAERQAKLKLELNAELKEAREPVKKIQRELKMFQEEKVIATQNLSRAKKRLKDARDEMLAKAGSFESEASRRALQLNETEEQLAQAKGETDKLSEAVALAYQAWEESEPGVDQAREQVKRKEKDLSDAKATLHQLRSSSGSDSASIFGPKCSAMKKLIDKEHRFQGPVVGPIGAYLKIAPGKEQYAALVEMLIGNGTLDRFIVTNDHDRKICEELRAKTGCFRECGLFKQKNRPRHKIPDPPAIEIETVASVLIVSNDLVFNCLVDQANIDQRALAPSKEVGEQSLLIQDPRRGYSIKGIIKEVAFLPRGDKWSVRDGSMSLQSNERSLREKRIGVDLSAAIEESQENVRTLDKELKELQKVATELLRARNDLQKLWNEKTRAKRANEDKIDRLTEKKHEIENEMETTADTALDTTELQEDVDNAEEALADVREREANKRKELEEREPALVDIKKRVVEVQTRNDRVLKEMREAEASLEACMERMTQSEADLEKKREKVKKYKDVIEKHQEVVDSSLEACRNALRFARTLTLRQQQKEARSEAGEDYESQRPTQAFTNEELEQVKTKSVPKDSKSYEAKLKRLKDKIEQERQRRDLSKENPTVAIEKHSRAKQDLAKSQALVGETEIALSRLSRDLKERKRRWQRLRKYLETMTDSRFDSILQLNQASGNLEFDDEAKTLNLVVQKDVNDPNSQTKDVKALSGGERSFTTISLLLALGESLETPFRVLDEFDVFMDTQARRLTIQTLIHIAKQMEHRQFIFITPQDLSSVTPEEKVKIFKMKAPERNQQAGGLMQSTLNFGSQSSS